MRLAPIVLFFEQDAELAIEMAGESSRTTHGARAAIDSCRYFAGLIVGALRGAPKATLLSSMYCPVPALWERLPLHPAVVSVAAGSFWKKRPPEIRGGHGYVIDTLEAALWAFASTDDFKGGALAAVNLGGDADTTGAVFGQIAGAFYGLEAIPKVWRDRIAFSAEIHAMAERLSQGAKSEPVSECFTRCL